MVIAGLWIGSIVLTAVVTGFVIARNPKILSVFGAYDQLVKKIKNV